jgi:hypothetical protein
MVMYPEAYGDNADWTKQSWDLSWDRDEFLADLERRGMTIEEFKKLPAYRLAVRSGRCPEWLKEL